MPHDSPPPALAVAGLRKRLGAAVVLRDLTFGVAPGELVGLVGPNGAGKSTTLRVLAGLSPADEGRVRLLGFEPGVEARREVGILPDPPLLFDSATPREHVRLSGRLHGLSTDVAAARADDLIALLGLGDDAERPAAECSAGTRRKTGIAMALAHAPRLLLLDEPFEGLDVPASRALRDVLGRLAAGGGAALVATQRLPEVERTCHRALLLVRGTIAGELDRARLRAGELEARALEAAGGSVERELPWLR